MHYYHKNRNSNSMKYNLLPLSKSRKIRTDIQGQQEMNSKTKKNKSSTKQDREVREHCAQAKTWKNNALKGMSDLKDTNR